MRLSSKVREATPKNKSIKESDFKSWENIIKDDFTNQMIDLKSDLINLQELHIPPFF
jgi:hypothetical protein